MTDATRRLITRVLPKDDSVKIVIGDLIGRIGPVVLVIAQALAAKSMELDRECEEGSQEDIDRASDEYAALVEEIKTFKYELNGPILHVS